MPTSPQNYRCLSVVFPAGAWIANGDKCIEVRRWIPDLRHDEDVLVVENRIFLNHDGEVDKRGVARALVKIREIRPFKQSDCFAARAKKFEDAHYAWQLFDVRPVHYVGYVVAARGIYDLALDSTKLSIFKAYSDDDDLRLCLPYQGFKDAFVEACIAENEDTFEVRSQIELVKRDFPAFVTRRLNYAHGENIAPLLVPWTEYWLMHGDVCVGIVSFRHYLNASLERLGGHIGYAIRPEFRRRGFGTRALAMTLERARVFGLKEVLITCDDNNIGSFKIIEANGGELIDKIKNESRPVLTRRYRIRIAEKKLDVNYHVSITPEEWVKKGVAQVKRAKNEFPEDKVFIARTWDARDFPTFVCQLKADDEKLKPDTILPDNYCNPTNQVVVINKDPRPNEKECKNWNVEPPVPQPCIANLNDDDEPRRN